MPPITITAIAQGGNDELELDALLCSEFDALLCSASDALFPLLATD